MNIDTIQDLEYIESFMTWEGLKRLKSKNGRSQMIRYASKKEEEGEEKRGQEGNNIYLLV